MWMAWAETLLGVNNFSIKIAKKELEFLIKLKCNLHNSGPFSGGRFIGSLLNCRWKIEDFLNAPLSGQLNLIDDKLFQLLCEENGP